MTDQLAPAEMREVARDQAATLREVVVATWPGSVVAAAAESGADALDRLADVIELHAPHENTIHTNPAVVCSHRQCVGDAGDQMPWPCPTVRIARGETNEDRRER